MGSDSDLTSYLVSDFKNNKYKNISLADLYVSDHKYFKTLERKHLIKYEAIQFFTEKGDDVKNAGSIGTYAFRKLKYESIINDYLKNKGSTGQQDIPDGDKATESQEITIKQEEKTAEPAPAEQYLHCIDDFCVLNMIDVKRVISKKAGSAILLPRYVCPGCKKWYTSIPSFLDLQHVNFSDETYINIQFRNDESRYIKHLQEPHEIMPGTDCFVYGKPKPVTCRQCSSELIYTYIATYSGKNKRTKYKVKFCRECYKYYLSYNTYLTHETDWTVLNEEEIPMIQKVLKDRAEKRAQLKAKRKEEERARTLKKREELLKRQEEEDKRREERKARELQRQEERKQLLKRQQEERQKRQEEFKKAQERFKRREKELMQQKAVSPPVKTYEHDNNIRVKDFVVRRTTFKCRHDDHKLQNIDATVNVITKNGDVKETTVSAGYCPNCNVFFIMESTYQRLKLKGTPVCRVSDEKSYLSNSSFANGMRLAQESVLMQYGYTVSQEEGLTRARRRKILALLIDNQVLTRSDIISYLDFFINQRKYQHRYEKAIEKWEGDREFVSEYNKGSYTQYGISGIYRKY